MKVKICGIRNESDLSAALSTDVDAIGFLVGQVHASPDFILPSTAARLSRLLPPFVMPVMVTHFTDPAEIFNLTRQTGIINVQLHGGSKPEEVIALRDMLPAGSQLILAAHFQSERDFLNVMEFYRLVDGILIDTYDENSGRVGGTGKTNNWDLAAQFIKQCPIPVILAGGLNARNVQEAIRRVNPYGVDANSGTKNSCGNTDAQCCREFVYQIRQHAWNHVFQAEINE